MALDFAAIKANVRIVDVLGKRGIPLRYNGEWGSARCPLPSHKAGDTDKTFQVNVHQNYFKCWSKSCNEKAGKKGGDVINLVALLDHCSEGDAAKKLSEMFNVGNEKAAQHIAARPKRNETSKGTEKNRTSPSESVKPDTKGYMADVDAWFDELVKRGTNETDEIYLKRLRNGVKAKLIESFKTGKRVAQSLPVQ